MPGKRIKRLVHFLLWSLVLLIVLIVAIPVWFPWALRPIAKRFGATFGNYERMGYSGLAVTHVVYSNRNVRVQAERIEVGIFRRHAEAQNWSVIVDRSNRSTSKGSSPNTTPSVHRVYTKVSQIITNVQRWIPQAALTNGAVRTPQVTVLIPGAHWSGADFSGQAQISNALPLTTVHATLPSSGPVQFHLLSPPLELESTVVASNASGGIFLGASNRWGTNEFTLSVWFGTDGVLPETARLNARSAVVPPVRGDVAVVWEHGRYAIETKGALLEQPISFAARIKGDTNSARVEAAEMMTPWGSAALAGSIAFSRGEISHQGSALVRNVTVGGFNRFDLALEWAGEKLNFTNVHATARADTNTISVTGMADVREKRVELTGVEAGTNRLDISAGIDWPEAGHFCAQLTNFSPHVLGGFLTVPAPHFRFEHLRIAAGWTNGPVTGEADFAGGSEWEDGIRLGAHGRITLHTNSLMITNVALTRDAEHVSSAYGSLPISITATQKPYITRIADTPIKLHANVDHNAFLWHMLATNTGVLLRHPEVKAELGGTWNKPSGRVSARAEEVKFREFQEAPSLQSLSLVAHIHEDAAEIEFLNFFVTNQPVTLSARMPLTANFWDAPRTNLTHLNWRDLSCRLQVDVAQIAAFAAVMPRWIAPQGVIEADIGLQPGGKLTGHLRIDGAGTRPIESVGALQDIEIVCELRGDKAQVKSHVGLGGQSVLGTGVVRLDPDRIFRRELPALDFHVAGENVPLARQADAVVRADVDVSVTYSNSEPARISGRLNLRDSLYLRELRDLIPGKLASPERRPPYFAVTAAPFAGWRLDLHATGQRFLKVRTPVFNGEVSADAKLSGTLGDPVAVGDLVINAGQVKFPFGNIAINHGIISLTSDDPYRPQLLITGTDRVLGYDINMELTGYADAPVLQFSSTPPLNSDQILLMLTAGEIPRQGHAFTTQQRAQRLALFFGRGMLSDLGIGGDSNRLTVRSGENVTETGRPTYSVEYELTDDWSVIGQYDRFNDFNLMLKWRVYSR